MSNSTFHSDGYRDALKGKLPSLPGIPVLDEEYLDGYCDALSVMQGVIALSQANGRATDAPKSTSGG
jgi:hypothetical protein